MDDKNDRELMIEASPINYVTEEFPRTILLSGEIDGLHDSQTLQFSKCLKEKQIPVTEVFFDQTREDAVHGFMVDYSRECTKESMEKVLEFLADR